MGFSKDFIWGAATSSYQIEGGAYEDGRGETIWDMYCRKDGAIANGHTGDVACDHFHRYKEDVALMKEMGLKGYRFSIAWSRIIPDGIGEINQKGIEFYNNLIDELLANDIVPFVTLFHWDLPLALHQKGGWYNPEISDWFANYAKVVVENFSDRVKHYFTLNEPQCFIGLGYVNGEHAPGYKLSLSETIPCGHNAMVAHGKAVIAMRKYGAKDIKIGYAPTYTFGYPETDSPEDIEAARRRSFDMPTDTERWFWNCSWFSDPVLLGKYPEDGLAIYGKYLPKDYEKDLPIMNQKLDFLGENLYNGAMVRHSETAPFEEVERYVGSPQSSCGWAVTPEAIKWCVKFLYERYNLPVYITENGTVCRDRISLDGKVHDPNRIDFYNRYLLALKEAVDEGVPVDGYFAWSLMDNFEWASGYKERMGLIYIDYRNQDRIIKDSGYWYKDIIESNGEKL